MKKESKKELIKFDKEELEEIPEEVNFLEKKLNELTPEEYERFKKELNTLRGITEANKHMMTTNLRTAQKGDLIIVVLPFEKRFITQRVRKVTPRLVQTKTLVIPLNKILTIEDLPRFRLPFQAKSKRIHLAIMDYAGLMISEEIRLLYGAEFIREFAFMKEKRLGDNWIIKMIVYCLFGGLTMFIVMWLILDERIFYMFGDLILRPPAE